MSQCRHGAPTAHHPCDDRTFYRGDWVTWTASTPTGLQTLTGVVLVPDPEGAASVWLLDRRILRVATELLRLAMLLCGLSCIAS